MRRINSYQLFLFRVLTLNTLNRKIDNLTIYTHLSLNHYHPMSLPRVQIYIYLYEYDDHKDIYTQYEPETFIEQQRIYLTYSLDNFAKLIDSLDLTKVHYYNSTFPGAISIDRDELIGMIQYDRTISSYTHVKIVLKYNSIRLSNFLMNHPSFNEKKRWLNICLDSGQNFWYTMAQEYLTNREEKDYVNYLDSIVKNKDDANFEQYIWFMQLAKLDLDQIQSCFREMAHRFLSTAITNSNYKIIKHFTTEFVKQCTNTTIYLDFRPLIVDAIFTAKFEIAELFIDSHHKLESAQNNFACLSNPFFGFYGRICGTVSVETLQYFHSLIIKDDIDLSDFLESFIIDLITFTMCGESSKPEFAYLVTAFPYEATRCKYKMDQMHHLDTAWHFNLIDETTHLEPEEQDDQKETISKCCVM